MTSRRDEERSERLESSPSQDVGDFENVITTSCELAKMSFNDDVFLGEDVMTPPPDIAPLPTTADVVKRALKSLKPLPEGCKKRGSLAIRRKLSGDSSEEEEYHSAGEEEDHDDEAKDGVHELADTLITINCSQRSPPLSSLKRTPGGKVIATQGRIPSLLVTRAAVPATERTRLHFQGFTRRMGRGQFQT